MVLSAFGIDQKARQHVRVTWRPSGRVPFPPLGLAKRSDHFPAGQSAEIEPRRSSTERLFRGQRAVQRTSRSD